MARNRNVMSNKKAVEAVKLIRGTCPETVLFNDRFERIRKLVFKFDAPEAKNVIPALEKAGVAFEVPPRTDGVAVVLKVQREFSFRMVK